MESEFIIRKGFISRADSKISGSLELTGSLNASGSAFISGSIETPYSITGSDVKIDEWGSVSASLSAIQSGANTVTLQDVTDNGNTTTNDIYISSSKSLYLGANSYIRREQNGGGNENIQLNGSVRLNPNTSANANNGVVIGGNGYLLAPNSSRVAQLNYGSVSGQLGVYRLNVYGADSTFQYGVAITGSLGVTGGITGSDIRINQWGSVSASLAAVQANTAALSLDDVTTVGNTTANNITVGGVTASLYGTASWALDAVSASHAELADLATNAINTSYAQNVTITGKNLSAGTIAKGTPLYFTGSGTSGNLVGIYPADADNPARMPAGGIAGEAITTGNEGLVLISGWINGVDTSAFNAGDQVYVAGGGGYTNTPPTGSALVQKLGNVEKVDNTNGSGVINGPGAVRSVPNIASGFTWVGDGDSVATPTAVSTLSVASAVSASYAATADAVGILNQDVTVSGNLTVFGTASFTSVTSSQLIVDDSFIAVNVFEPAERFGGLRVYDSGSLSHQATASLAWDSLHNHWVYQNASGSTYSGGMFLAGPRNTGSLGDEPTLTRWYIPRADGGDHLNDSQIYSSGSKTDITGSLTTTGKVTVGTVDNHGADPDKFLAIVDGEIVYRTGTQLLSDIGGQQAIQDAASGTGSLNYITKWTGTNSIGTSVLYDNGNYIGIDTTTPRAKLDISGSNAIINEHDFGRGKSTSLSVIAIGSGSLSTAGTTQAGVHIGINASSKDTSGTQSVVIGDNAHYSGSRSRGSVLIGSYAGAEPFNSYAPFQDVYIGQNSGRYLSGYWNTAIGKDTMVEQNRSGGTVPAANIAIGTFSMYGYDFQGSDNVAVGVDTLYSLTSGSQNTAVGHRALVAAENAGSNVAIGHRALEYFDDNSITKDTGPRASYTGNTGLGSNAAQYFRSGSFNTFLGVEAGQYYYTGSNNVVLGRDNIGDLNNTEGNLVITAGKTRIVHSRDGLTTLSGSLALKGTTTVVQQGIQLSGTTSLTVASINTTSYDGAFLDYLLVSGSNRRAGTLTTVWTASDIEWKDTSTLDLGSTDGAEFAPAINGSNADLVLSLPTGTWTVKGHLRYM